jgi:hypothetical protein
MEKIIKKQLQRECLVCGKSLDIIVYGDYMYDGGYYFDFGAVLKSKENKDAEYWECQKCFEE